MDSVSQSTKDEATTNRWLRALFVPLTILAWLAVIVIAVWLLGHVAKTILTLILSGVLAFALTPLVSLLARWMPRGLAIALAYVLGFAVILGLGAFIIVSAAAQVTNLVHSLPNYAKELEHLQPQLLKLLGPFGVTQAKLVKAQNDIISAVQGIGTAAAKSSLDIITGVFGTVVDIVLVLILSIYLTANGPNISQWLRRQTPITQRWRTSLLITIVNQVVGGYIRGTLTMAALIGVLVGVGMAILHVPYAVLLGLLAFFMEFIPIVGVLVSGGVCVLVALTHGWLLAVLVLGYFVLVHVVEGDVVGPRVMGHAIGIHPATALIALVAGTELFGLWGALFGAPLAGLLQAILTAAWREWRGGDPVQVIQAVAESKVEDIKPPPGTPPSAVDGSGSQPVSESPSEETKEPAAPVEA